MAAREPLWIGTGASFSPEEDRLLLSNLLRAPRATYVPSTTLGNRPGNGIVREGDFLVTQDGAPGMRVLVAAGSAFVSGSQSAEQGVYAVRNDGGVVVNLAAADAVNRRNDIVVARVQDADYSGAVRSFTLAIKQGANYAGAHNNANDPVLDPNTIPLARVQVAPGVVSILNAAITDLRQFVPEAGRRRGTAAARLLAINVEAGEEWFETDTDRVYRRTAAGAWTWVSGGTNPTAARAYAAGGTSMALLAFTNIALATESYDYGNNFAASAYTCPETALYDVRAALAMSVQDSVTRLTCGISINGTVISQGSDLHVRGMNVNDSMGVTIADQVACAAGDVIRLVGFQNNNGGAARFCNTGVQTWMAIRRV